MINNFVRYFVPSLMFVTFNFAMGLTLFQWQYWLMLVIFTLYTTIRDIHLIANAQTTPKTLPPKVEKYEGFNFEDRQPQSLFD